MNAAEADSSAPPRLPDPMVLIEDPAALESMELGLGPTLFHLEATDTLALRKSRRFRELASRLRSDELPGWWLRSSKTEFQLAAVVNRLDRQDMIPGTCGETRLVYRLVHHADAGTRPLPIGLNVLFVQQSAADGCQSVARSWRTEDVASLKDSGGPLSAAALSFDNIRAVESNLREGLSEDTPNEFQIHVPNPEPRWDRPDWKGGVLEFNPSTLYKGRGWRRVTELMTEPLMREAIAQGTATTASRGISYGQWDSTRADPFERVDKLLPEEGDYAPFEDKAAFLERGRSLTCGGCHSTRAVDGFHASAGVSAHLLDETGWRVAYVTAVAEGREPNRVRLPVDGEAS